MIDIAAIKEAAEKAGGDTWDLVAATEHHGPYVAWPVGDVCDFYTMSNPSLPSTRNGGESHPVPFYCADEHAAFVALANPSAILSLIASHEALVEALERSKVDLDLLLRAVEENDPVSEIRLRVKDALRIVNAALNTPPKGEGE